MSRKLVWTVGLGIAVLALLLGGYFGLTRWRVHVQRQRDIRNLTEARRALEAGSVTEARRLYSDSRELGFPNAHLQQDWKRLELDLALNDPDPLRLLSIFQSDRALVEGNERACLSVVGALRQLGRREEERAVRERWRGKETVKDGWLFLDAEGLVAAGREPEARKLLESQRFEGDAEGLRLVRLARLLSRGNQIEPLLDQAILAAPTNVVVLTARGRFYESQGSLRLAAFEFASALAVDPSDRGLREQAGDFFFRAGARETAIEVWSSDPSGRLNEVLWLKSWFWRRVLKPSAQPLKDPTERGELAPFIAVLQGLPPKRFWDAEAVRRIPNVREIQSRRPEFVALEILDACVRRDWPGLVEVLDRPGRQDSLSPELENALYELGHWRVNGRAAAAPGRFEADVRSRENRHPLLKELGEIFAKSRAARSTTVAFPATLQALVTSDHGIAAMLLAVEWPEMALLLTPEGPVPPGVSELYLLEHAMALRSNRGAAEAEAFLSGLQRTPAIDCLRGEVLLALGKAEEGRGLLKPHSGLTNRHGMRAAYLLGIDALERKAWEEGRGFIRGNASLAASIQGRELEAQLALAAGNMAGAESLFAPLARESPVAARFLAERAKARGDFAAARDHVARLAGSFPDNPQLRLELLELRRKAGGRP
jgi:tetratricopeptide (TPR) repeat protein